MNLSELSDYQINVKILEIKFPGCSHESYLVSSSVSLLCPDMASIERDYDWCNDDALAFRLMIDNRITLMGGTDFKQWCASSKFLETPCAADERSCHFNLGFVVWKENPNRAISECFILMSQGGDK